MITSPVQPNPNQTAPIAPSGKVSINRRVLVIALNNVKKFVVRGWLELPDITILEVCGPWYDDDVVPAEIFSRPEQGPKLNKRWVRKNERWFLVSKSSWEKNHELE